MTASIGENPLVLKVPAENATIDLGSQSSILHHFKNPEPITAVALHVHRHQFAISTLPVTHLLFLVKRDRIGYTLRFACLEVVFPHRIPALQSFQTLRVTELMDEFRLGGPPKRLFHILNPVGGTGDLQHQDDSCCEDNAWDLRRSVHL